MDPARLSSDTAVGKLIRLPLQLLPKGAVLPILTGPLAGRRWIVGSHTHGCWVGTYEAPTQRLFAQILGPGGVFFDVGANVGFYTLLAAVLVGEGGRVVAFQPASRNARYLRRHVGLNRLRNVDVFEVAVLDRCGVARFDEERGTATGKISDSGALTIQTVSIDQLVDEGLVPTPDVIKIDVEGAEMDVLRGAEAVLRENGPAIFVATHSDSLRESCCELLA